MADVASSKAASKKKSKKESSSANAPPAPIPIEVPISNADMDEKMNGEQAHESAWMKDLSKQIRNINKKINSMQKTDAILAENPGVSLDQLVASRKMNADQKLQAERKPGLQAELNQLKNQQEQIRRFEEEQNKKMAMALDEVRLQHQQELESVRAAAAAAKPHESATSKVELRESLLILSQFLRAAAARRVEANDDSDESRAFEGVLLLLYGGDATAVDAAEKLVTGSTEEVPSTEGQMLSVSYARVRELSNEHSPYAAEEAWIQGVAQSEGAPDGPLATSAPTSDPTIVNAGLTEIDDQTAVTPTPTADAVQNPGAAQMDTGAANISASDSWDKPTSADPMAESWVSVPRDPTEMDTQPIGSAPGATQNWADDTPEPAMESMTISNDGFREVRHSRGRASYGGEQRGRGRGGPRGDRGRGGPRGGRGDGSFTGGRGGRGGGRGGRGGRGESGGW